MDSELNSERGSKIADLIRSNGLPIYGDPESVESPFYYENDVLEALLATRMVGHSLQGLALRTRSKVAKTLVCESLGYEAPNSFKKTRPRFPSPNLDLYVQKANNLQVWNEEVDPNRRYVVLNLDDDDVISAVRVVTGQELALLDKTGTLTSKYQAKRIGGAGSYLVNDTDTPELRKELTPVDALPAHLHKRLKPTDSPRAGTILSIRAIYEHLSRLVGTTIDDPGITQERARGVLLQQLVCTALNLGDYADAGQFPDILCQALEVKLQLSPTVDLGLVSPDSTEPAIEMGAKLRRCDARYAVVYGERENGALLRITEVVVSSGTHFFSEFRRFEGNVQNRKLQIRLPADFFRKV